MLYAEPTAQMVPATALKMVRGPGPPPPAVAVAVVVIVIVVVAAGLCQSWSLK